MRTMKLVLKIFIAQLIVSAFLLPCYALEKETHFEINKYIAKHNIQGFSLDEYLKNQLEFQEGINTILEQYVK